MPEKVSGLNRTMASYKQNSKPIRRSLAIIFVTAFHPISAAFTTSRMKRKVIEAPHILKLNSYVRSIDESHEKKIKTEEIKKRVESSNVKTERTNSFGAALHTDFDPESCVKPHTLILGTHPSITSLKRNEYFAHSQNAFWWIAGDCLGFRRSEGIASTGKPFAICKHIKHQEPILSYNDQLKLFTSKGFVLWDVVKECERKGSLDKDIKMEQPNDLRGLCSQYSTIKRIVFANGFEQCRLFNRHFQDWWLSGELIPGSNEISQKAFKKYVLKTRDIQQSQIECICLPSVSPAAASISYVDKREQYKRFCYDPGLQDHTELNFGNHA
jgi:TDG/mug DNA glycosylase family protein